MSPVSRVCPRPRHVGDEAARLADEQRAGGDVPARQPDLEEAVVAPARRVGEVERGGAGAAESRRRADERFERLQVVRAGGTARGTGSRSRSAPRAARRASCSGSASPFSARPAPAMGVERSRRERDRGSRRRGCPMPSSTATETAKMGTPWMKFVVPSSGSTIQRRPAAACRGGALLGQDRVVRKARSRRRPRPPPRLRDPPR